MLCYKFFGLFNATTIVQDWLWTYSPFHTWNDQRFTSMENSRTKLLKYLHCFQNFGQFKILKFYVQSLASNAQSPQSSFQFPESSIQSPEPSVQSPTSRVHHPEPRNFGMPLISPLINKFQRKVISFLTFIFTSRKRRKNYFKK